MVRDIVVDVRRRPLRDGFRPTRLRGWTILGMAIALIAGRCPDARASGIFRDLTARDRSQPILLSATGEEISLPSAGHPTTSFSGKIPAYLAFPLDGGEHLPASTPTIATGPQSGQDAVGPLGLSPASHATLNADLLASRGAIVDAPGGSYAVAMLPRYARALASASGASAAGGDSGTQVLASMFGLTPNANWTIQGVSTSELSKWFQTGAKELTHLTTLGATRAGKSLGLKVTPTNTGFNVAPQYLDPPPAAAPAAESLTVATPEPGSWIVFAAILLAARVARQLQSGPMA